MDQRTIIGFCGKRRAGKDTAAQCLSSSLNFAFAYPLKYATMMLFNLSQEQVFGDKKEIVDERYGKTPRQLLQWLGTDIIREHFGKDHFVNKMKESILNEEGNIVITDVRFDNEAELIKSLNGIIIEITNPNLVHDEVHSSHESESGISRHLIDYVINNDGTIEELHTEVLKVVDDHHHHRQSV